MGSRFMLFFKERFDFIVFSERLSLSCLSGGNNTLHIEMNKKASFETNDQPSASPPKTGSSVLQG